MLTLNLADESQSDIKYTKVKYPDSQVSIILDESVLKIPSDRPIFILSRFNNYEDLFLILAATDVLRNRGKRNLILGVTCFLGQRSDRRFKETQSFDLKIITDIINSQNYVSVLLNEPHSDVVTGLINNSRTVSPKVFFNFVNQKMNELGMNEFTLISPDAGAYKKVYKIATDFNLPLIAANKYRDEKGNITLNVHGDVEGKTCLILDDYCDGGRTFTTLASFLKNLGAKKVVLAVVHGLYSAGIEVLKEHLDCIISTNSISDIGMMHDGMKTRDYTNFIYQFDLISKND